MFDLNPAAFPFIIKQRPKMENGTIVGHEAQYIAVLFNSAMVEHNSCC